jgi:hypothetical protein
MNPSSIIEGVFPNFIRYVQESGLADKAKGNLSAKIPRILGQGKSRADRLDLPPALIERKQELATFVFPDGWDPPAEVLAEIEQAKQDIGALRIELLKGEAIRRLAVGTIQRIGGPTGYAGQQDGHYYADQLILSPEKGGMEWSWSITPHYPIIKGIPPDLEYLFQAFEQARRQVREVTMPEQFFEKTLSLAWGIARHFSDTDDVLVLEVMKMFRVAAQDERFWQAPQKKFFTDFPEGHFVVNLINWRLKSQESGALFEFVPATLHQASGKDSKVFYLPMNRTGTEVRPMVYMRKRTQNS